MKLRIVPAEPWHIAYLSACIRDADQCEGDPVQCLSSFAWTGFDDEEVIGASGITPLWPGVGEAWSILSPTVRSYPMFLHRHVYRALHFLLNNGTFHRVQCSVLTGDRVAEQWAQRLGFSFEGLMHQYSSNKLTFSRFAIVQ